MSAFLFPTADALRLTLASGVIPPAVARGPVAAGVADGGEVWLAPSHPPAADVIAALARIGVRSHAPPPGFVPSPLPCWAAALPLKPDSSLTLGPQLVRLPVERLAGFVAAAHRFHKQPVRFVPDRPFAMVLLSHPPTHLLDLPHVTAYYEPAAGVWVRDGWQHPLPQSLFVPAGQVAFVDPPASWRLVPMPAFLNTADTFPLSVRPPLAVVVTDRIPQIVVPVRLKKHNADVPDALWAFDGSTDQLTDLFNTTAESILSRFMYAVLKSEGVTRVWAMPNGRGKGPVLPEPFLGFVPHPLLAGVFLPIGATLSPSPRADRLAELLQVGARQLVCVESRAGLPVVHRIPLTAFRPLAELVTYTAPACRAVSAWTASDSRLTLAEVRLADAVEPPVPMVSLAVPTPPIPVSGSWLTRLADRLLGGRPEKPKKVDKADQKSSRVITPVVRHTPDRDARRRHLEQQVIDQPTASAWAALAAETAKPADAALCWVNALWDRDPPPAPWLAEWVRAERRGKPGPRLAAALAAEVGFSPDPHPDAARLPELLRVLDARDDELPVRAVWLARLAAARAVGGDPLALARVRDRLLARLAADGPSLDLDAPAFLRFHGTLDGDRFRAARDWLMHAREPIHKWLHKLSSGLRLGWAGLDPDPRPTAAYADLMLAWGLSRLGERTKSDELTAHAERVLTAAGGHGVDPAVHAALFARFVDRIRDAQHGRARPLAPPSPAVHDPEGLYAITKLADRCRTLAPHAAGNPYAGHDLAPLIGTDAIGHRLDRLSRQPSEEAVAGLLADTAADPTAATLPRVVLVAVELPVTFPHRTAERLMLLLPAAVALLPEAVRVAFDPHADPRAYAQRLTNRLVLAACRLATRHDLNGGFGGFVRSLLDAVAAGDGVIKTAIAAHLPELFAALRKLGLTDLAGELAGATADQPVGWFVMGRDDTGWALLDAARERLFVTGIPDDRDRTTAAFGYVAALTHAPPRLALGRLEELFQRLDRVTTAGATARYFALTPLELIDRAVSAVVTDEFNLGPAVRRWLDDDEFVTRRRIARDLDAALARP
jgi:hypothetical protein